MLKIFAQCERLRSKALILLSVSRKWPQRRSDEQQHAGGFDFIE
jgi:hypothetical protein